MLQGGKGKGINLRVPLERASEHSKSVQLTGGGEQSMMDAVVNLRMNTIAHTCVCVCVSAYEARAFINTYIRLNIMCIQEADTYL